MKKHIKDESGVAVVEASIYLPFVIAIVFFLVYLAFFYMEEFAMFYAVERAASEAAREYSYRGYTQLDMNADGNFEFAWTGNTPSKEEVDNYYKAKHGNENNGNKASVRSLYRELGKFFSTYDTSDLTEKYDKVLDGVSMIAAGTRIKPEITLKTGVFSSEVTATVSHSFRTPGIMRYLGAPDQYTIRATTKKLSTCPANFVRDVDLGADFIDFVAERLGFKDKKDKLFKEVSKWIDIIL